MDVWLHYFSKHDVLRNTIVSLLLLLVLLVLRRIVSRFLQGPSWPDEVRLRSRVQLRTAVLVIWTAGLVIIWATELRTLAISAVAVAAAVVIAPKNCSCASWAACCAPPRVLTQWVIASRSRATGET